MNGEWRAEAAEPREGDTVTQLIGGRSRVTADFLQSRRVVCFPQRGLLLTRNSLTLIPLERPGHHNCGTAVHATQALGRGSKLPTKGQEQVVLALRAIRCLSQLLISASE